MTQLPLCSLCVSLRPLRFFFWNITAEGAEERGEKATRKLGMTDVIQGCRVQCMGYHLWVKICGIMDEADAGKAVALGADAIGLNFHKESPRYVTVEKAESIIRAIPRESPRLTVEKAKVI